MLKTKDKCLRLLLILNQYKNNNKKTTIIDGVNYLKDYINSIIVLLLINKEASLPISVGGIVIICQQDLSLLAFLSSYFGVLPLFSTTLNVLIVYLATNLLNEAVENWET